MKKHTYFIADLHLDADLTNLNEKFTLFITKLAPAADAVYILGDLFRLWVGDDVTSAYLETIKQTLFNLSKAVPIFLMPGNRDYLLGQKFACASGCTLLPEIQLINLYGKPTLLSHGDIFCTKDLMHMLFRRLILNKLVMRFFLLLPIRLRKYLAEKVHLHSAKQNRIKEPSKMDVTEKTVTAAIKKHHATQIIHGHTHKAAVITLMVNANPIRRIVLDTWNEQGSALKYYEDGSFEMLEF